MSKSTDKKNSSVVFLIPSPLHESGINSIHPEIKDIIGRCQVFFVENERSARRYLKQLRRELIIDDYEWYLLPMASKTTDSAAAVEIFRKKIEEGKNIGIISEAGCPGVADPGQLLIAAAHEMNITIKPLAGPSSILLALMASGMNGQHFRFCGYLPINPAERIKSIKELEAESAKKNCTQIFIETPYRNNQLIEALLKTCRPSTRICIAAALTGPHELIKTKSVNEWKKEKPDLHKQPALFCLLA